MGQLNFYEKKINGDLFEINMVGFLKGVYF